MYIYTYGDMGKEAGDAHVGGGPHGRNMLRLGLGQGLGQNSEWR